MNATLKRATHTSDIDYPRRQVHITSIPAHQHTCNVQESASQPARSKPYCTNRREEEGLTWPFASSLAVTEEWRWPTQAQLMRSDILQNIDVLGRECLCSLVLLSPRGR